MSEEKCYCVTYYSPNAERYVYSVSDTSGMIGETYYCYDDDIPKRLLLTEAEAQRVARGLSRRFDNVSVSRVYSYESPNEKCYCITYYSPGAETYVYTTTDSSRDWGESYYRDDNKIPRSQLLTREQAKELAKKMRRRFEDAEISRVYFF